MALVSFVSFIVGMFVINGVLMKDARWRSLVRWLMLFPAASLALLLEQDEGPLAGLLQRMLVTINSTWLIIVAWEIRSMIANSGESGANAQTVSWNAAK